MIKSSQKFGPQLTVSVVNKLSIRQTETKFRQTNFVIRQSISSRIRQEMIDRVVMSKVRAIIPGHIIGRVYRQTDKHKAGDIHQKTIKHNTTV